jgi:hypothetical protein
MPNTSHKYKAFFKDDILFPLENMWPLGANKQTIKLTLFRFKLKRRIDVHENQSWISVNTDDKKELRPN